MTCHRRNSPITRSTLCFGKTYNAEITLVYPDPLPVRPTLMTFAVTWNPPLEDGTVELELHQATTSGGDVRFNAADGGRARSFTGNIQSQDGVMRIVGVTPTTGEQTNLSLKLTVDDEKQEPIPLRVQPETMVTGEAGLEILKRELKIAAAASRPASGEERTIWDRYNALFTDATAFADALATIEIGDVRIPLVNGREETRPFDRDEIMEHLRTDPADRSGVASAKSRNKVTVFDAFQGKWRGRWRQKNECGDYTAICQDHEWRQTEALSAGSHFYAQPVLLGEDSRPYADPSPGDCFALEPGRDVDIPAMNLINISTGIIVGAVGVRAEAEDDGVHAMRPHVGFFVNDTKLLWVAEEGLNPENANQITYSVFYEIREQEDDEGQQLYTIQGFDFTWDRKEQVIASPLSTKGSQYRLILTPEEEALRQDFNNQRLRAGHLDDLSYRRRLEALSSNEVQDFLDNAEDADLQDYLRRLKDFVEQQEALNAAPVGNRPSITFIMGADRRGSSNQFYTSATGYFTLNPAGNLEVALRSLDEVRDHLDNNLPEVRNDANDALPWGEINIVVHANAYGGLSIPVVPGGELAHAVSLQREINENDFLPLSDDIVDSRTVIQMRGCALGNTSEMLQLLSTGFGGANTRQRPIVRAPKHLQGYSQNTLNRAIVAAEQFYAQYWYVGYPQGRRPPRADLVQRFEAKYPEFNIDWDAALRGNLAGYTLERRNFSYIYNFSFLFGDGNVPNFQNDAARLAWLRQESNLDQDLPNSYGEVVDDFDWAFNTNVENLPGGARRLNMEATGRQELDRISRNLTMDRRQLFTLALNFSQTLDNRTISNELRTEFSDQGHALSAETHTWIRETGSRWVIVDPGNIHSYFVELDGQVLNVLLEEDPADLISAHNSHAPTTHTDHFGSEVPAIPAQRPLGENVEP